MVDPYTFHFHSEVISTKTLGMDEFPAWGQFHLPYADKRQLNFSDASLLRQSFASELFHAILLQLDTGSPFDFSYGLADNHFFLYFMLQGGVDFATEQGRPISRPRGNRFYVTHNAAGTYLARCDSGRHIALAVTLSPAWLADIDTTMCPHLEGTISRYLNGVEPYGVMPNCRMGKPVHEWLEALYGQYHEIPWVQGSQMMAFISYILAYYDRLAGYKLGTPAYKAMHHISSNFGDNRLSIPLLADTCHTIPKTLTRNFVNEFGQTPHQYLMEVRLWNARDIFQSTDLQVKEVYPMVGYRDERSFRKEFVKLFGHPPRRG